MATTAASAAGGGAAENMDLAAAASAREPLDGEATSSAPASGSAAVAAVSSSSGGAGGDETSGNGRAGLGPKAKEMLAGCGTWQRTSLMIAARHGQLDVVQRALETSCSQPQLDSVDERGDTAVIIAARHGHVKVVEAFIKAGADLSIKNMEGKTASDVAATEEIRRSIAAGEAQVESIMRAIYSMANKKSDGSSESCAAFGSASGTSAPMGGGLAALLAGAGGSGAAFKGECPF
eukprot:TRINITY_DN31186_c0_g2_i1.p1 TRINITY_DN31186_c0_g2~~TRINITY_DN31186_c0_g2_i1.p1  ORF type:complete len:276 (-),score=60.85 TRINITY_DN31186_c0_g2_i1:65-769(-)